MASVRGALASAVLVEHDVRVVRRVVYEVDLRFMWFERSVSSFLDTLTPVFELYVRLRERRQRAATCVCGCVVAWSALMVGGTDTSSRHWSPASPVFQCLTLESLGQSL
ncbi:hypothetical protein Taro_046418 [Colocasia esculenta]|uniref:Uncharacterized protein n=1 Tax=Colocasia esculenta TaxID=4460 RepID=A0A843WPV1_COLES|nr:hypothetical protein [Colocasia esculenta]